MSNIIFVNILSRATANEGRHVRITFKYGNHNVYSSCQPNSLYINS